MTASGALGDRQAATERGSHLFEPHVAPLNRWVQGLRDRLPDGAEVPWFDPADGGVRARLLWLGEEPPVEVSFSRGGPGVVSLDGPDGQSRNLFDTAAAAGVDRSLLVLWNAMPCNRGALHKAGGDKHAEVPAVELLSELLALLPDLEVVVLAGREAWQTFHHSAAPPGLTVLSAGEVRDGSLDGRPRERAALVRTWADAAAAAGPPGSDVELHGDIVELVELDGPTATASLVLVQPVGHREVVAFGSDQDLAALGRVGHPVPSAMTRSVRMASAALPTTTNMATSGRVVWLTKESAELLERGEAVRDVAGNALAVVRDPSTKKFIGQIRFQDLGRMGASATMLPTLLSAVAMQQQMAAIERRLAEVQERLDDLIEDRRIELDAGLDTNLEILEEVAERTRRRDELEPAQWQRLATIEPRVRDFQKRTWSALGALSAALDPDRPLTARTKELAGLARDDGLARQLVNLVKAEVALARWQGLQLLHDAQEHPEELEERTEEFLAELRDRHHRLVVLARRLDGHLGAGAGGVLDRARAMVRRDAAKLRTGLAEVLDAYRGQMEVLGLEAPPPPPPVAELSVSEQLGDSLSAVRHRLGRRRRD